MFFLTTRFIWLLYEQETAWCGGQRQLARLDQGQQESNPGRQRSLLLDRHLHLHIHFNKHILFNNNIHSQR